MRIVGSDEKRLAAMNDFMKDESSSDHERFQIDKKM